MGTFLNPAQVMAEIAMAGLKNGEKDTSDLLSALLPLTQEAGDIFSIETFSPGKPILRQGETVNKVRIILDGKANMFRYGGRVAIAETGEFIGAVDAFTSDRVSQFEYSALDTVQVLSVDPEAFLAMREKMEKVIREKFEELKKSNRDTVTQSSADFNIVSDDVLMEIHTKAIDKGHFVPIKQSGNELIFECGTREQVLCWLGVRGLLTWKGTQGWKVIEEDFDTETVTIARAADAPQTMPYVQLAKENLVPAFQVLLPGRTQEALQKYVDSGLGYEQARFLVERGFVPSRNVSPLHLQAFQRSFSTIQQAMSYTLEWMEQEGVETDNFNSAHVERETVGTALQHLLIDTSHRIASVSQRSCSINRRAIWCLPNSTRCSRCRNGT